MVQDGYKLFVFAEVLGVMPSTAVPLTTFCHRDSRAPRHRLFSFLLIMCSFVLAVMALLACRVASARPVFPGAVGFGSHTVAGRGGVVYRVTNLDDSGPGSLRHGIEHLDGPRVVVFEVSGVIELKSDLTVRPLSEGNFGHLRSRVRPRPPRG
jgi:hypothetical protein